MDSKPLTVAIAVLAAGAFVIFAAYQWSNTVPSRPTGVRADAVFLWAPYVGVPGPRRGWWLACWEEAGGRDICKLSDVNGSTEFEGQFLSYDHKGKVPADQLEIDPVKTREHRIWVGHAFVPLVYLQNGDILVPAEKYEEGKRLLDHLKSRNE